MPRTVSESEVRIHWLRVTVKIMVEV